ncbi:hypothetical protein TSUD_388310 [Trifolium subterraneum]|uniref:Plus3 domain-containing protein n=1 Tax=Trifolium subterraneum TaxID=3900 RepID=A0A1B5Z7B5_TRISU|nr:hypothetical protein TSUD_388310 [Trifolium subterraneum]
MIMKMNREKNKTIAKASSSNNKPPPLPSSTKIGSSARNAEKTAAKGDALSELRAKRMKQQMVDNHGKSEMKKKKKEVLEIVQVAQVKENQRMYLVIDSAWFKKLKVENRVTHKYLICVWGSENSAAKFQVAVVSDSTPLEKEFKQWLREVERTCSYMPSKVNVMEKKEAIKRTNTYVYSAATVKQMLEEKKTAPSRPLNIAVEKDRLKRELDVAESKNDEAWMERILTKLAELEALRRARENNVKAIRLDEMNRKNRVENYKNLAEHRNMNANLKAGEEGYDPFSRRWTRSRNYFNEDQAKENKEEGKGEKDEKKIVGVEATKESLKEAADAGKLIDTTAPVDVGTESNILHDP